MAFSASARSPAVRASGPLWSSVHDSGINTGDNPENRSFTKATPSGEAWMTVDNKAVWPAFRLPL